MKLTWLPLALLFTSGALGADAQTIVRRMTGMEAAAATPEEGAFRNAHCDELMSWKALRPDTVTPEARRLAREANRLGMKAYRDDRHEDATDLFYCATSLDSDHALAHYNLASEYARTGNNDWCSLREVVAEVGASFRLDPARKKRFLVDPDFERIHNTVYFRVIAGTITLDSEEAIRHVLLDRQYWNTTARPIGAYKDYVQFYADGTARRFNSIDYDPNDLSKFELWTWTVRDKRILMTDGGGLVSSWPVTFDEELGVVITDERAGTWVEPPWDCDI